MQRGRRGDLLAQIRAGVDEEPMLTVHRSGDARLAAWRRGGVARAGSLAAGAGGIPLRKPTTGAGAEYNDPEHQSAPRAGCSADFGAGVAVDLARERYFDDFWFIPGHATLL